MPSEQPSPLVDITMARNLLVNQIRWGQINPFYAGWKMIDVDHAFIQTLTEQRPYKASLFSEEFYYLSHLKSNQPWEKQTLASAYLLYKAYNSQHPKDKDAYRMAYSAIRPEKLQLTENELLTLSEIANTGNHFATDLLHPKIAEYFWFLEENPQAGEPTMGILFAADKIKDHTFTWRDSDFLIRACVSFLSFPEFQGYLRQSAQIFNSYPDLWFPQPMFLLYLESLLNQSPQFQHSKDFIRQTLNAAHTTPLAQSQERDWLFGQTQRQADQMILKFRKIMYQYPDYERQIADILEKFPKGEKRQEVISRLNQDIRKRLWAEFNIKLLWTYKAAIELNYSLATQNKYTLPELQVTFDRFRQFLNEAVF